MGGRIGGFGLIFNRLRSRRAKADALLDVADANPEDDTDQTVAIDEERREAKQERYE